jgi:alginate O-acetyltransferase complex protein AlgJ
MSDEDGDGHADLYGQLEPALLSAKAAAIIADDYAARSVSRDEVNKWAHELASYWYPAYNTDIVEAGASFPSPDTEPDVRQWLRGASVQEPTVVIRGVPRGIPLYTVLQVDHLDGASGQVQGEIAQPYPGVAQAAAVPSDIRQELETLGRGSWKRWLRAVAPAHRQLRRVLKRLGSSKGLVGRDGYLFYGRSLQYVLGGDISAQPAGKNPLPAIVAWAQQLHQRGVAFVFVPVPTKVEVVPHRLLAETKVPGGLLHPDGRKLVADLRDRGVTVVDLLPAMRAAEAAGIEVFLKQDTHWSDAGLQLAAERIYRRIGELPGIADHPRTGFAQRRQRVSHLGDIPKLLPDNLRGDYSVQPTLCSPVVGSGGEAYVEDAHSPITVIGDSFTGIFERTLCDGAGVAAHLGARAGIAVDLLMSWGGGPNVRRKLLRRGSDALKGKAVVVWVMTGRDLFDHWEDWEKLAPDAIR